MVEEKLELIYSVDGYLKYGMEIEFIPAPKMKNFDWMVRIRRFNHDDFKGWLDVKEGGEILTTFFATDRHKEHIGMEFMNTIGCYSETPWCVAAPAELYRWIIKYVEENSLYDIACTFQDDLEDLGMLETDLDEASFGVVVFDKKEDKTINCLAIPIRNADWLGM